MRLLLSCLVAAAAVVVPAGPALADPAAAGTVDVLTYNIAGLPEGLSSAPAPRGPSTTAIGQRLSAYDIVNVQEDFNYHAALYAADSHPYRTATSGGAGLGSGLNTLSAYPYDDAERGRWTSCRLDSGDCLTPKGFTFLRTRVADGVFVDVYNLHTDAGTNAGDQQSRAANLSQLTAFIGSHSAGNAVVVMGDTNTRWTRAADTIRAFVSDNGLTDTWVQLVRGGVAPAAGSPALVCDDAVVSDACEVVDKVLYRSSRSVTLRATAYHNESAAFRTPEGIRLSDHDPVSVRLAWTANPDYRLGDQFGGPHGDHFTDVPAVAPDARVTAIGLRAGNRLDQLSLTLADGTTLRHGGPGGTARSLTLAAGEYVASATVCRGVRDGRTRIFSAGLTTNLGATVSGGTPTADCVTWTAPAGRHLTGFHGRAGAEVDKLGPVFTRR
ncbi:endonuclease/exonuclease/phosphatase family protein [Actinoplanes sp. NPDC048967]|uniref:jacalin-like lectin n=1 Tax=Actinoplanes sp. NPDC048967 TaxID=3155269 RepID=UPI0033EAD628